MTRRRPISTSEVARSFPRERWREDPLWTSLVLRPISFPLAALAIWLGMSANGVSYLSLAVVLAGGGLLVLSADPFWVFIGAVFLNLFALGDCVDGNVARTLRQSGRAGEWTDALGGYVAYSVALLSLGALAGRQSTPFWASDLVPILIDREAHWAMLGGVAAVTNLLMRVQYQHYRNVVNVGGSAFATGRLRSFSQNLGITGVMMPAILYATLWGGARPMMLFYATLYSLAWIYATSRTIIDLGRVDTS